MSALRFSILTWSAWAPGVYGPVQWQQWANAERDILCDDSAPGLKQVPAMLRRRLSRLSKMSLQVVYDCVQDNHTLRTVFCSAHGEIHRTKTLLDDIAAGQAVSPMGFSLSVHNTASGLYSIASVNQAPSTAIAAGADSLEAGIVEAVCQLQHTSEAPVLVVLADEPLPAFYQPYESQQALPFALALLLDLPGKGKQNIELTIEKTKASSVDCNAEPHGLSLIRFLHNASDLLHNTGERVSWRWRKADGHTG